MIYRMFDKVSFRFTCSPTVVYFKDYELVKAGYFSRLHTRLSYMRV